MKIKIYKQTIHEQHVLYVNTAKRDFVLADKKETTYKADSFIFAVCDIIHDWPTNLENENILDGLQYKIVIKQNNKEKTYIYKNKFPEDIYRLEMLISAVLEEVKNVE